MPLPRYDIRRSYRWNYDHSPEPVEVAVPPLPGSYSFAGLPAASPLGIPAGPLLNGRWIEYYASLGFDVLTYKTVRSGARDCYPVPNLVHVPDVPRGDSGGDCLATDEPTASWAVSFGMPSAEPSVWRRDIAVTRERLPRTKLLNVSVVGSVQPNWTLDDLANDYARCAKWAVESGADVVEANLSCPNVDTCDGQLYQQPESAGQVARRIRAEIGDVPLVLKIGHVTERAHAESLLAAISESTSALAMTNSVPGRVRDPQGNLLFEGASRGICGRATFLASLAQVQLFADVLAEMSLGLRIIAVGGVGSADEVRQCLAAGAESVQLATAAMLDPEIAIKIRATLAQAGFSGVRD